MDPENFKRLRTAPGIGPILGMILVYEIHDIRRFPRVQDFVSYARLVKCAAESAGKRMGTSGAKIGNVHSEVGLLRGRGAGAEQRRREEVLHPPGEEAWKGKGTPAFWHIKLGRAVYFMMKREEAFENESVPEELTGGERVEPVSKLDEKRGSCLPSFRPADWTPVLAPC